MFTITRHGDTFELRHGPAVIAVGLLADLRTIAETLRVTHNATVIRLQPRTRSRLHRTAA